ncbi:MAG TPA: thiamine phosphate synthase [Acidimicrobiales bacterium]|nr:thiamine phosphate synthase [Acidimicrobiales bacterium]
MTVPRFVLLTDRRQARQPLSDVVRAAVDAGCRAVLLRERDLPHAERTALAADLGAIVRAAGGVLLSAGAPLRGCDGVQLPRPGSTEAIGLPEGLVGRSCHDAAELAAAQSEGVRYATVSPIFATASKPGYGPALGLDALAALVAGTTLPVLALGGIETPERVARCVGAGAHGVAVMGAVMRAEDPGRCTSALVAAAEAAR